MSTQISKNQGKKMSTNSVNPDNREVDSSQNIVGKMNKFNDLLTHGKMTEFNEKVAQLAQQFVGLESRLIWLETRFANGMQQLENRIIKLIYESNVEVLLPRLGRLRSRKDYQQVYEECSGFLNVYASVMRPDKYSSIQATMFHAMNCIGKHEDVVKQSQEPRPVQLTDFGEAQVLYQTLTALLISGDFQKVIEEGEAFWRRHTKSDLSLTVKGMIKERALAARMHLKQYIQVIRQSERFLSTHSDAHISEKVRIMNHMLEAYRELKKYQMIVSKGEKFLEENSEIPREELKRSIQDKVDQAKELMDPKKTEIEEKEEAELLVALSDSPRATSPKEEEPNGKKRSPSLEKGLPPKKRQARDHLEVQFAQQQRPPSPESLNPNSKKQKLSPEDN